MRLLVLLYDSFVACYHRNKCMVLHLVSHFRVEILTDSLNVAFVYLTVLIASLISAYLCFCARNMPVLYHGAREINGIRHSAL
jgi:hypothetical protein